MYYGLLKNVNDGPDCGVISSGVLGVLTKTPVCVCVLGAPECVVMSSAPSPGMQTVLVCLAGVLTD